jgi:molybdate transport system substrate-binding protein
MVCLALLVLLAAAACGGAPRDDAAPPPQGADRNRAIVVSAAASLSNVLDELGRRFGQRSGAHVAVNVGASNTLARQIAAGARVDLFISADESQMDIVTDAIVPGTRVDLLSNQLAVAVPDDRFRPLHSVSDLQDPIFRRIAIGEPSAVPAGVYAKEYLEKVGLWARLSPRMVPSGSVRLALAAVETGAADAAIVYRTDVPTAPHARTALVVPVADGPRIVYPAAVIRTGANQEGARQLLAFLQGHDATAAFERAGFVALSHDR